MNTPFPTESPDEREGALAEDLRLCEAVTARDPEAMEEFYVRYHRLAEFMARKATGGRGTMDHDDLIQEALIKMYESANVYRVVEGQARFSRYATSYLLPRLRQINDTNQIVGLPAPVAHILGSVETLNLNRHNHGLAPMSDEDISAEFITPEAGAKTLSVKVLRQAMMLTRYMGSIDIGFSPQLVDSPGNAFVLDERVAMESVTSGPQLSTEDLVEAKARSKAIDEALSTLNEREEAIIRMRHGLDDGTEKTYDAIAEIYGISRTRVIAIYHNAISKMRDPARKGYLEDFDH